MSNVLRWCSIPIGILCSQFSTIGGIVFLVISLNVGAVEFVAKVVGVADGDTISILADHVQVKVRLTEIDAPESKQPFGSRAKQELSTLVFGKTVTILSDGHDRYGRMLGRLYVDKLDVNAEMVRRGYAWVFDRYVTDKNLYALQDTARLNKLGLWSEQNPIPPWNWRRHKR